MRKTLIFSQEEFQRRVRKTKEMMDKAGMEILLVTENGCEKFIDFPQKLFVK